ncbi:MAG TPA: hypothetical protein DCQ31_06895 [Bacteroidales bacterium]|nr:hypothetical protein [Bacteroidales bacterium]
MKLYSLLILLFISSSLTAQVFTIELNITNISHPKGKLYVTIYSAANLFLDEKDYYRTYTMDVKNSVEKLKLENLPKGNYAISLFHDANLDGKCNLNFIGIPTEGYGFSRNFKPTFRAPKFSDCKITLTSNYTDTINLIN